MLGEIILINKFSFLATLLISCNSQKVVDDAQCTETEQDMFLTCVAAGCSASYEQDLSGEDQCDLEGGGSVVSVEAGGECAFTTSGSCYVVCDCPEGVSVNFEVEESSDSLEDYEGDTAGECSDGADNDRDGLYDCEDLDCKNSPDCQEDPDPIDTGGQTEDTGIDIVPDPDTGGLPDEVVTDGDGDGYSEESGDCDDRNPAINPSASDIVGDIRDQNCDGIDGTDMDRDGFASESSGGGDCNDFDSVINPDFGVRDVTDRVDSNCDGFDGLDYGYNAILLDGLFSVGKGDFDGDGLSDIIVRDTSYEVFIVYGSTINSAPTDRLTVADVDVTLHLVTYGTGWATDVTSFEVKDIDADGKDDLAFSYRRSDSSSRSFLYYGSTIESTSNLIPGSNEDVVVWSSNSYYPNTSITFTDDLTGDGVPDVWVLGGVNSRLVRSSELGFGGDAATWSAGLVLPGGHIAGMGGSSLAGLDSNSNGYPDFRSLSFTGYRDCYRDIVSSPDCLGYLNTFKPDITLPDIDGDGEKELSDGVCVQNLSSFSDSTYCDYRLPYNIETASQIFDLDGDGRFDLGYGSLIVLDTVGTASDQIEINDYIDWSSVGDYDGNGNTDLVVSRYSVGTYIVGIR